MNQDMDQDAIFELICSNLVGAWEIMAHMMQEYDDDDRLVTCLKGILDNQIFGEKLYYVWKINCKKDYYVLLEHNFDNYDQSYFDERF